MHRSISSLAGLALFALTGVLLLASCDDDDPVAPAIPPAAGGTVAVQVLPASLAAPWTLTLPDGTTHDGEGDTVMTAMPIGAYSLTWGDVADWLRPDPSSEGQTLANNGTITFQATYGTAPPPEPVTFVITALPEKLDAAWEVLGPDGYSETGTGSAVVTDLAAGEYRIRWENREGWYPVGDRGEVGLASPGDTLRITCTYVGPFVDVPAGTFTMGSPETEVSHGVAGFETLHEVTLTRAMQVKATEVTVAEYMAVMGDNDLLSQNCPDCPVDRLSWGQAARFAMAFTDTCGFETTYVMDEAGTHWEPGPNGWRLPTDAEWEYACRAGTTGPFNTGECIDTATEANLLGDEVYADCPAGPRLGAVMPVGSYFPNAWGLYDMHGNIAEYCWSWYGPYADGPLVDPIEPESIVNNWVSLRSGAWFFPPEGARSAVRSGTEQGSVRYPGKGVRIFRNVDGGKSSGVVHTHAGTPSAGRRSGATPGIDREYWKRCGGR